MTISHKFHTSNTHTDVQQRERTSYMKCIVIICVSSSSKRIKSKFIIFEIVTKKKKRNVSRKCKGVVKQEQTATYTYFDRDAGYLFIIFLSVVPTTLLVMFDALMQLEDDVLRL